jgi:hypothetical protein
MVCDLEWAQNRTQSITKLLGRIRGRVAWWQPHSSVRSSFERLIQRIQDGLDVGTVVTEECFLYGK